MPVQRVPLRDGQSGMLRQGGPLASPHLVITADAENQRVQRFARRTRFGDQDLDGAAGWLGHTPP